METYHKIQTLFKRHQDGPHKGKMIPGAWTTPELEYLAPLQWSFSEKVDGTNIRVSFETLSDMHGKPSGARVRFGGRSDNAIIPKPLLAYLEETFTTSTFTNAGLYQSVYLYGEGYGAKVQNGGKYRDDQSFVLFDVKIGGWWLSRENVHDVGDKLGIEVVPEIGRGTLQDAIDIVQTGITFNKQGALIRWGSSKVPFGLKSQFGDFEAEGIVARPEVPLFDRKGQRIITKIKAVDFR